MDNGTINVDYYIFTNGPQNIDNFIYSYITINYGASLSYVDLSSSEIYSFNILNSNFSNYNNNSTFYINDFF